MATGPNTFYDRVKESSTTTGTGTYTLGGAVTGYQSFSAVGNTNLCYYSAYEVDGAGIASGGWEVGIGTYTSSGTTLARTTIIASSNSNSAVSWSSGTRHITVVSPAYWVNRASRVLLATQTASNSASLDFLSCITSAYDDYEFDCTNILAANNSNQFVMRVSTNNSTFDTGANYNSLVFGWSPGGADTSGSNAANTLYSLCNATTVFNNSTHGQVGCTVKLINPLNSSGWKKMCSYLGLLFSNGSTPVGYFNACAYMSTSAVNAVSFFLTSGNITSGTIKMYGLAK